MAEVTEILHAIEHGDPTAADKLMPLVYAELRRLAEYRIANEKVGLTLQATALVHEAYLRLVQDGKQKTEWNGRGHFYAAAAESMRRILVDNARSRNRIKRGGERSRVDFDAVQLVAPEVSEDLLSLDEALTKLAATDPQAAELVKLRYFAGLTFPQAAESLGVSTRTVQRIWIYALRVAAL